jgi:DNA-binding MarR family transcriptional regulator
MTMHAMHAIHAQTNERTCLSSSQNPETSAAPGRQEKQHDDLLLLATRRRILGYLACYPLLRTSDLAAALNRTSYAHLHTSRDASNMARHLRELAQAGLVEAVRHAGVKAALWRLTRRGAALVATMTEPSESDAEAEGKASWFTSRQQVDRTGNVQHLRRLARLVLVQDIALGLCIHAPDGFANGDRGRRPGVAWHWMRDWQCRFVWRHRAVTAGADAVLLWQRTPGQHAGLVELADASDAASASATHAVWHCALVLVERAQETQASIQLRVERLIQYRESSERLSVYGEFPPVLVVLHHQHHRAWWNEAVRAVAGRERVSPLAGALALLPEDQAGCVDPWRLAWQSLADGSRIALADILVPLRREAWPAGLSDHLHAATTLMQQVITAKLASPTGSASSLAPHRGRNAPSSQCQTALPGPRHGRLLVLLAKHPLLSLSELAALLDLKASSTERYLRELRRIGYVQASAVHESRSTWDKEQRWWLTANGVSYAAATAGTATLRRAARRTARNRQHEEEDGSSSGVTYHGRTSPGMGEPSLRHAEHLWGIYGFLAALHQAALAHQASVCWWEMGEACERSYPWHRAQRNLRPDAEFELVYTGEGGSGVRHLRYWLEYDRGTMRRHDLEAKMGAYADYLRAREWVKDGFGRAALPRLLFVVPDSEQERRVAEACVARLGAYRLRVLVTTTGRVEAASPYAPIWRQVFPPSQDADPSTRITLWA